MISKKLNTGNTRTYTGTYNQDYNPTTLAVSSIYSNTLTYDSASNIIQMSSGTYGYDALLRMSSESGTLYTYDATSNRTAKGGTSVTVPSTSNKISAVGANALTYDSAGNILTYNGNAYSWNAANQLSFVSTGGGTVGTYTYNYLNQRTQKLVSGTTTHYVYGLNGQLYGEYTSAGALVREYIYLNGQPLAQVNAGSPETATWLHTDQLGTPRFGTNAAGTQVWAWNSDAFGNGTPTGSITVNLRLPGQYFDSESGLFNNWNRYYNPALGRYITSDPIGLAGGSNTFNYVQQSPLMYADLTGKSAIVIPETVLFGGLLVAGSYCYVTPACHAQHPELQVVVDAAKQKVNDAVQWCKDQFNNIFNPAPTENTGNTGNKTPKDCDEEWEAAYERCGGLLGLPDSQRPKEIWGGSFNKCVSGQVSQACGGNRVD